MYHFVNSEYPNYISDTIGFKIFKIFPDYPGIFLKFFRNTLTFYGNCRKFSG